LLNSRGGKTCFNLRFKPGEQRKGVQLKKQTFAFNSVPCNHQGGTSLRLTWIFSAGPKGPGGRESNARNRPDAARAGSFCRDFPRTCNAPVTEFAPTLHKHPLYQRSLTFFYFSTPFVHA